MVRPVRRRQASPAFVQQLWEGVHYIRGQKQIPNNERMIRYMVRNFEQSEPDVERQLQCAVEDGLILAYMAVGCKGSKVGTEQEGFRLPDPDDMERDGHDWYCFDCHQPGEVLECSSCWRVYHPTCTEEDEWTSVEAFVCNICSEIKKKPRMKRKELNRLLGYTVLRLKDKAKELYRFGHKEDAAKIDRFVYMYVDLNTIEQKTRDRKFKYLEQFISDARTIIHNTFIVYGEDNVLGRHAKIMIRDCMYDVEEIRQCSDCYYYSNAKPKDWFCQPCRPPHELVYAKQKGFCHWPAKVIKVTKEGYDVRFFGGWHQRAIIPKASIKAIECSPKQIGCKRTAGFVKSCEELRRHQELLEQSAQQQMGDGSDEEQEMEEEVEDRCEERGDEKRRRRDTEPEIKHKKFRKRQREEEVSSSHMVAATSGTAADIADDANLVSSSMDPPRTISTSDTGTQTSKKLSSPGRHKLIQTDAISPSKSCNCESKFSERIADYKEQLSSETQEQIAEAVHEAEERLQVEFEQEKEQAVAKALASKETEAAVAAAEEEETAATAAASVAASADSSKENKKLIASHKAEISATKKKQWCYNCEEEAMYQCCWNTSYCSIKCQQEHWHREHKRMCRRKRN